MEIKSSATRYESTCGSLCLFEPSFVDGVGGRFVAELRVEPYKPSSHDLRGIELKEQLSDLVDAPKARLALFTHLSNFFFSPT